MQRNRFVLAILGVAVVALCAGPVAADEAKAPDPMKVLKSVTKNLVKEARKEGYRATLNVEGGISKAADHSLWNTTVREAYEGDIRGNVMHVPGMQVFRTSQKGAVFDGTQWAALQARADGKKLDRLFAFPVQLLSKGLKNPKKVTWLESTEEPEEVIEEEEDRGLTSVAKRQTLTREQMYHRLRVEIPDKEALQYFVEVQNSGCLSGG